MMILYEKLEDFMEAYEKTEDKTIYMKTNKIINKNQLIGEIIIQFKHNDVFHVLKYREEIKPVTLLRQETFDAIKEYIDEETMKKTMSKYEAALTALDEQITKQKALAEEAFKKKGCTKIIEALVIGG